MFEQIGGPIEPAIARSAAASDSGATLRDRAKPR